MPIQKAHFSAFITRLCQSFHQLIKRFVKLRNAFFLKLPSHYIDIYAKLRQYLQNSTRPNEIVFNANLWFAMLTISVHSFNWYCIYSIHSYKRLNIFHITIFYILSSCTCPKKPLSTDSMFSQFFIPIATEYFLVNLISCFGTGNGNLSTYLLCKLCLIAPLFNYFFQYRIHKRVYSAYKETCN